MLIHYKAFTLMIIFLFTLTGCANNLTCKDQLLTSEELLIDNTSFSFDYKEGNFNRTFPEYYISAGDILDVLFHIQTHFSDKSYQFKLENDNKIFIKFAYTPELNEEQYIRPDGTISLPILGEVEAAGKTVIELQKELREKYSRVLQNPELHILVPEFSKRIEELKKDLHTAPRGLSRLVTVRSDGYVTFPMVGEINVVGHTVPTINKELNKRYESIFRGLQVDLFVHKSVGSNVYVLGNVNKVGVYEMTRPITILEALTLAGGAVLGSDLEEVLVLRRHPKERKVVATRVNVEKILDFQCDSENFFLKPDDLVYVPKTGLTEAADSANTLKDIIMFKGWGVNLSPVGNVLDVSN